MIAVPAGVRVWLASGPTDMRRGMNSLALQVQQVLKLNAHGGDLFVFRGKRGDLVKILRWDGSGLCLFAKRLEKDRFVWPPIIDDCFHLTPAQLALLIEGIDWRRTVPVDTPRRPVFV